MAEIAQPSGEFICCVREKEIHFFNSFAPEKIVKKNVRKVAARKTVIIIIMYLKFVCKSLLSCLLLH